MGGGEMISVVREEGSTWASVPHKFEAGTPNIADVIAFGAAIEYLEGLGMDAVRAHEVEVTGYAMDELEKLPGLTIHGPRDPNERGGVVSFAMEGIHPHDISHDRRRARGRDSRRTPLRAAVDARARRPRDEPRQLLGVQRAR